MSEIARTRWLQRLENFETVLAQLLGALAEGDRRPLSELEKAGTVQYFELCWEMGWKLMADYLVAHLTPPKSFTATMVIRDALAAGIIDDGDGWIEAGKLRHSLSHTYSEGKRNAALDVVETGYVHLFNALRKVMRDHAAG